VNPTSMMDLLFEQYFVDNNIKIFQESYVDGELSHLGILSFVPTTGLRYSSTL